MPMQAQQIWVAALPCSPAKSKPFAVRANAVLVHLSEDDLCSSVSIGDLVDIVGQAQMSSEISKIDCKLLGDVQVPVTVFVQVRLLENSSVEFDKTFGMHAW